MDNYTEGIAFILEGATEKVFYKAYLEYLSALDDKTSLIRNKLTDDGEIIFCWQSGEKKILIKFYVVGTITQIVHSGKWFLNMCSKKHKMPWFYEGDWKILRQDLEKSKTTTIVDLAASADIEDIMLYDIESVLAFLGNAMPVKLVGRKGKAKMKALYRSAGRAYHEGERAKDMISKLDFSKITQSAPIKLAELKDHLAN